MRTLAWKGLDEQKRTLAGAVAVALATVLGAAGHLSALGSQTSGTTDSGNGSGMLGEITLLTGDQVQLRTFTDGKESVTVKPGPGREHVSFSYWSDSDSVRWCPPTR
jgi:hypothetical protein